MRLLADYDATATFPNTIEMAHAGVWNAALSHSDLLLYYNYLKSQLGSVLTIG
ncbi:hypothetical protein RR42_m1417 [Cupriavidus basilensis]|uniref:Uncharacterized protein n=1 Tax=Cupriavidus basilensis TaxID=68895 RepID=A0A0C4Y7A9_9BURK|nr:hypothetical protein RR42_m1417 [Cupriavidus basilensis]